MNAPAVVGKSSGRRLVAGEIAVDFMNVVAKDHFVDVERPRYDVLSLVQTLGDLHQVSGRPARLDRPPFEAVVADDVARLLAVDDGQGLDRE